MTDWTAFAAGLGDIPVITEPALVRQKSRDFFWYSPILKAQLNRMSADIVACPRTEAEVDGRRRGQCARWHACRSPCPRRRHRQLRPGGAARTAAWCWTSTAHRTGSWRCKTAC